VEESDPEELRKSIEEMVARIQEYVPGYRLRAKPLIEDFPGRQQKKVTLYVEVEGAGDYLPQYAGNLDIMTSAGVKVGEEIGNNLRAATRKRASTRRARSHALSHQFTAEQVARVARGLDQAGIEMIEVSHGDGLGGSTVTYGFSKQSELELLEAASSVIERG